MQKERKDKLLKENMRKKKGIERKSIKQYVNKGEKNLFESKTRQNP